MTCRPLRALALALCVLSATPAGRAQTPPAKSTAALQLADLSGYRQFLEKVGSIPAATTPEEFGRVFSQTVREATPYVREFHMQIE